VTNFLTILLTEPFLQYALLCGLLASISCGIVGSFVVARKIEYISGGIAHTVLAGMGALITALLAALIIGSVSLKAKKYENTIISALWSVGMAIGIIFIAKTPGYNTDLMSYLFGNILMSTPTNLYLLATLDLVIIVFVALFYKQLLATAFDEEFARLRGIAVNFYFLLLLCLVALTIVSLMQVVGLILMLALLTMPAAIARQHVGSVFKMIFVAIILGAIFTTIGIAISYQTNLPTGATIILFTAVVFLFSTIHVYKKFFVKNPVIASERQRARQSRN
jgi:zinc transport system permease protein